METINRSAITSGGYHSTNNYLRSVLIHRIGVPLLAYLNNEVEMENVTRIASEFIPMSFNMNDFNDENMNKYNNVLKSVFEQEWKDGRETTLTTKLSEHLLKVVPNKIQVVVSNQDEAQSEGRKRKATQMDSHDVQQDKDAERMTVRREGQISSSDYDRKGRFDIVLSQEKSVVTLIEFGLLHQTWWRKHHQNMKYARVLLTNSDENLVFNKPMLLVTITVDPNVTPPSVQFGVFLCTNMKNKNNNHSYRIALLWRAETKTISDASKAFGKIIYCSELCAKWREECSTTTTSDDTKNTQYTYLGPNCSRLGNKLYRCYDIRLRPTCRKPTFYEQEDNATKELDLPDKLVSIEFGDEFQNNQDDNEKLDWLWKFKGKVLIISTTFHDGVHYAERPEHFQPIVKALARLHSKGYVHGDIRAFNMVLQCKTPQEGATVIAGTSISVEKVTTKGTCTLSHLCHGDDDDEFADCGKGYLIDFDMSGKQGETRYPKGYNFSLRDGDRYGLEGELVSFYDDWYALFHVIFSLHEVICPDENTQSILDREKSKCNKMLKRVQFNSVDVARSVIQFLECTKKNEVPLVPGRKFELVLKEKKMWRTDTDPNETNHHHGTYANGATGSLSHSKIQCP